MNKTVVATYGKYNSVALSLQFLYEVTISLGKRDRIAIGNHVKLSLTLLFDPVTI